MSNYRYSITHYNNYMMNSNTYMQTCHYVFDTKQEAYEVFDVLKRVHGTKSVKLWKTTKNGTSQIIENYIYHEGD